MARGIGKSSYLTRGETVGQIKIKRAAKDRVSLKDSILRYQLDLQSQYFENITELLYCRCQIYYLVKGVRDVGEDQRSVDQLLLQSLDSPCCWD